MTTEQKDLFDKLYTKRRKTADALNDPSVSGFKKSVVDKYSDQAHFIYELLQNADDVGATKVVFELKEDKLIYKHNGTRHFNVTDVVDESDQTKLGDLNAITSIGNSSKTTSQKIGKFGVGFKAVFQYTDNPVIYDPIYHFRIDDLIVPVNIENDFPGRKENETIFEFPFNIPKKSKEDCFEEISYKLRNLSYPLLFLKNLQSINFSDKDGTGFYSKEIDNEQKFNETIAQKLRIINYTDGKEQTERLWLFTRTNDEELNYSVGFFIGTKETKKVSKKTGEKTTLITEVLRRKDIPAFCYFSTQMETKLGFIIHAPFLLTDSREGIKAGEKHNHKQIQNLSDLAADCFVYLKQLNKDYINESIFNLIPYYNPDLYGDNKNKLDFSPFYQKILNIFSTEELLPTHDGFTKAEYSFIAYSKNLPKIFTDEKLAELYGIKEAKWTFPFLSPDSLENDNEALYEYLQELTRRGFLYSYKYDEYKNEYDDVYYSNCGNYVSHVELFGKINKSFIENQTIDWLAKFYGYISDIKTYSDWFKNEAIFLDTEGKAVAAFDSEKHQTLFLPSKNVTGYKTINAELLSKNQTKKIVELYGLREPSFKDEIYKVIFPSMSGWKTSDYNENFKKLFNYYLECNKEDEFELLNTIKNQPFLQGTNSKRQLYEPKNLYFKTENLERIFADIGEINYVDFDYYQELLKNPEELKVFFGKLGIKDDLSFIKIKLDSNLVKYKRIYPEYKSYDFHYSTESTQFYEYNIEYLKEILDNIERKKDVESSVTLWKEITQSITALSSDQKKNSFSDYFKLEYHYKYYSYYFSSYTGRGEIWLKTKKWLLDKDGNFKSCDELYNEDLSPKYETFSKVGREFLHFLNLKENPETELLKGLTEEEKKAYLQRKKFKDAGFSDEEIEDALAYLEAKRNKNNTEYEGSNYPGRQEGSENYCASAYNNGNNQNYNEPVVPSNKNSEEDDSKTPVFDDIKKAIRKQNAEQKKQGNKIPEVRDISQENNEPEDYSDVDDYAPKSVDFQKKIDRAKNKTINEIMQFEREQILQNIANNSEKYSYAWFDALLQLEIINSKDSYSQSREVSICFTKVEKEEGTEHTLILKQPNKAIPQFMEELTDISLKLIINGDMKNVTIDAINVLSYNLRVKLKPNTDLKSIDFSKVKEAHIEAMSPVFLLDELKNSFDKLSFAWEKNLKNDLCSNIEFIFGPPGTGKTTHLVNKFVIPIMKTSEKKILVLTPTNKAADVLTKKVMEFENNYEWLIRFGVTSDESIESSPVFKGREFDINSINKAVVVTTIARFPYDYFISDNKRYEIKELNWDYIIIDEASMISLVNIIYPLYKKQPEKFIIAGDPFQIEPITAVELWKNENIYTMVELNSFTNPTTKPQQYKVELLSTQYRSLPAIGQIYGHICYGNVLKHHRTKGSGKSFTMKDKTMFNNLNIIYFPVSEYESIYKSKSLNHKSPYQIYLAIFIYEFIKYISDNILIPNGEKRTLGVIAPYRAQADLIQKLCERATFNAQLDVQVSTIHGFQGDECDIIIDVFNPPEHISGGKGVFLNKKNIINVAVSRARDYLFVVIPDKKTKGMENLRLINLVDRLCIQGYANTFTSKSLEKTMFDNCNYIEENTFSTSHQNVNVYGTPEKKYEVRTEDSAVDIQIHKKVTIVKMKKKE